MCADIPKATVPQAKNLCQLSRPILASNILLDDRSPWINCPGVILEIFADMSATLKADFVLVDSASSAVVNHGCHRLSYPLCLCRDHVENTSVHENTQMPYSQNNRPGIFPGLART